MAANLCRTRAMLQIPRAIPALIARTQSTQTTPSAGKGVPTPGNFNSAVPPPSSTSGNTSGNRSSPSFGDPAGQQSFLNSPAGKIGAVAVLAIAAYAGYKMLSGNKEDSKEPKDKKEQKAKKDQKDQKDNNQNKAGGGGGDSDEQGNNAKGKDAKK